MTEATAAVAMTNEAIERQDQIVLGLPSRRLVIVLLSVLVLVGFAFRVIDLDAIGFAEDEVNKVDAIRAYEHGDITANGEHPMLMKAMMFASLKTARFITAHGHAVSDETAFRFPNAVF